MLILNFLFIFLCANGLMVKGFCSFQRTKFITRKQQLNAISKEEKEAQFKLQQEMLARRKNKDQMKSYFESKEEERKKISKEASKTSQWQKSRESDVLEDWKKARAAGEIKGLGYEPAPDRKTSLFGNIIVPGNPIGMPNMDNGERFDLRLPYAERGYEDPDADIMGKFFSMFTGNKKNDIDKAKSTSNSSTNKSAPQVSKDSKKVINSRKPLETKNDNKPQAKKGWW